MNKAPIKYVLASFLIASVLAVLPQCKNNITDGINKCGGVQCSLNTDCQSMMCNSNMVCDYCENSDTSSLGKCEGLPC